MFKDILKLNNFTFKFLLLKLMSAHISPNEHVKPSNQLHNYTGRPGISIYLVFTNTNTQIELEGVVD